MITKKNTKEVSTTETKHIAKSHKQDASCSTGCCGLSVTSSQTLVIALLIINTFMLAVLLLRGNPARSLEHFEQLRVGGAENQRLMKELYNLPSYQQDQNQKIQEALLRYKTVNQQTQ